MPPSARFECGAVSGPILETKRLTRTFRLPRTSLLGEKPAVHAVRSVDLEVGEGETLGLVGESGSGKTTLAHMLIGLDKPTGGAVRYRGNDIGSASRTELRDLRSSMQIIFQDPNGSLDPRLKVGTIITEPLRSLRTPSDHSARLSELLDAVGLSPGSVHRYPHEFSGGQRQRIAIARALAPHPKILIADEPVSALDVSVRAKTLNLLQDLKDHYNLTLVIISHDLSVMHHLCDRIAVMYAGRIVEIGQVEELFADPKHPYTRTLLNAIPRLRGGNLAADDLADTAPPTTGSGCAFSNRCPLVHEPCHAIDPPLAVIQTGDGEQPTTGHQTLAACHALSPRVASQH